MSRSTPSPRLLRALTVLVGALLGCAVAAVVARRLRPRPQPGPLSAVEAYGRWAMGPCYRVEGDRLVRVTPPGRTARAARDFPLRPAPGTVRVAVVGESTGEMIEGALADLVAASRCPERVEVLECSTFGAHPALAVRRAEEVVAYAPHVLVVAIGHNYRNPRPELASPLRRVAGVPPSASDEPVPPMARASYEAIVRAARPRGVRVLALQLASNVLFRPHTDAAYVDSAERATAWVRWARGDVAGAVAALSPAAPVEPALRAFERARFLGEAGRWAEAREDYERARDLDECAAGDPVGGCAHRASRATNAAIAQAARAAGAATLDVDALLAARDPHGIVGWSQVWDYCHPDRDALDVITRATLARAAPSAVACATPLAPLREAPLASDAVYQRFVGRPPRGIVIPPDPAALDWRVFPDNAGWRRVVDGPLAALLREAPDLAPAVLARYDRERLAALAPAVRGCVLAALGESARDAGRLDVARWALEASREVAPATRALVELALVALRMGDAARAQSALVEARALGPRELSARVTAALGAP